MSSFRADLHCHSHFSDGTLSPQKLIGLAVSIGLQGLSITDHDTIEAYHEAIPAAKGAGLALLTGVEFSTTYKEENIHVLGYGFPIDSPPILQLCKKHVIRRQERNAGILQQLKIHGMPVNEQELLNAKGTIGRPHIASAMVQHGYVESIQEAFKNYLEEGKPCYVPGEPFSLDETLDAIRQSGGISSLAHPHLIKNSRIIKDLLAMPFNAVECYYARFPSAVQQRWIKIAEERKLLITGGSDYHGDIKPHLPLGCSWVNEEAFSKISAICKSP